MQVQAPREPMRLRDLVPLAHRIANVSIERLIEAERKQRHLISCRKGCSACCKQLIPISAPEAFLIADHVIGLDEETRAQYLARIDAIDSEIAAAGLLEELDAIAAGNPTRDISETAAAYFEKKIPCPFLLNDACSVYNERPLACRAYLVTTPAIWCDAPTRFPVRTVPKPQIASSVLAAAAAQLTGDPPAMIPLGTAMRWVDANVELGFREWSGIEVLSALLRELGIPETEIEKIADAV